MQRTSDEHKQILDSVIRELHDDPVDLLSIGDGAGESLYLDRSRLSYLRTLEDLLRVAGKLGMERGQIRILEIGAFLGVVSCTLARLGFAVTALDLPEFMVNQRLKDRYYRHGVKTLAANLRDYALPAQSGEFDIVIMCETLEHLNFNPLPVLAEVNRVVAGGGYLYLSLPNQASLVNRAKLLTGRSIHNPIGDFTAQLSRDSNMIVGIHWREYTAAELKELVELGGFSMVSHFFFTTHRAGIPARCMYLLFPRLRGNQTIVARKTAQTQPVFRFCEASR
ncbi:MAG: methyltransferase type 11 [Geobacteraceae bacterium GWC2_58_44]|nr:MAG: methyltransferase type 11 [Geobacteraceae bacterium GWC2_58_44]HBG06027.1 class I SAM-dependent methyltransferase [Geobacter sp.]